MKLIGVDLGGTKITAALIEDDKIVKQFTSLTPFDRGKIIVIDEIKKVISEVYDPEILGIGIGIPGLIDLHNKVVIDLVNIPSLNDVPLMQILEDHFQKPVYANNDANCFALGEKYFGKGKGYRNFIGMTFGTGLGAGIIINDHLYPGNYCGAGEFGSLPYRNKTVEAFASGQFFKDQNLSGSEMYIRAMEGNEKALLLFEEFGMHIGRSISNVLLALAPEAVILGGSVINSFPLFERSMKAVLEDEFPYQKLLQSVKIECSELKNSAVFGAASLVMDVVQ
jgi:glucokinase